jgi:hypothetical protein
MVDKSPGRFKNIIAYMYETNFRITIGGVIAVDSILLVL